MPGGQVPDRDLITGKEEAAGLSAFPMLARRVGLELPWDRWA